MKKIILISCVAIIFIYSTYQIIGWIKDSKRNIELIHEIKEYVNPVKKEDNKINFDKLKKINKDVIGWINVNNTNIDYPIVQTNNNKYYLNHSFDKTKNEAGWIFMDYRNNDFKDKNTILYGHNRIDNTMFGSLLHTLKKTWYTNKDNHIITITTNNYVLKYKVFSVYHIKKEDYYISINLTNNKYKKFLNTLKKRSIYNFKTPINNLNQILTLSTCYKENERIVLHAILIKKTIF